MTRDYLATLLPAKEGGFTVFFRDFPEAMTQGKDIREAMNNAEEALALTVEEYADAKRSIPVPSDYEEVAMWTAETYRGRQGVVFAAVQAPDTEKPFVRASVSFTKTALARIDRKAEELGMTRSGYLSAAGVGYQPDSDKGVAEQLEDLGRNYGLGRKPGERHVDFVLRIFREMSRDQAAKV
jgi:predicted RNase H-like HicB family nuclease